MQIVSNLFLNLFEIYIMDEQKSIRRRGDELMESLFDATFKLMNEVKHTNLTFGQIAEAAKTSRSVLYRRWPTTFDLLQDIYTYKAKKLFDGEFLDKLEDTGSLRGDLNQLLTICQSVYDEIGSEVIINYYYIRLQDKDNSREPQVHTKAVNKFVEAMKTILENAKSRGENIKVTSGVALMLPFDLIRIENLVRMQGIDSKRLETLVDEILLPVFKE
ncbi:TetR/AcrR family transcriptional regulator [Pedobacter kyonggii]|nr:TetR/AcrR family transcriptional regulator [Pedobacter kyonggii]